MKQLWTEKYRPDSLEGYVFRDPAQREQIESWIKSKTIPHLLFSGAPGVGKTTWPRFLSDNWALMNMTYLKSMLQS
jgi:replication-associated recombination protein RarA